MLALKFPSAIYFGTHWLPKHGGVLKIAIKPYYVWQIMPLLTIFFKEKGGYVLELKSTMLQI